MNRLMFGAFLVFQLALIPGWCADQTVDRGWCVITCPEVAGAGQPVTVKVEVKQAAPGLKLGGDLHLNKPDGTYGGYGRWGGDPKPVKPGDTLSLKYTMPDKEGIGGAHVLLYLSPKGYDEAVEKTTSPVIKVDGAFVDPRKRPGTATLKKSWIHIGEAVKGEGASAGEEWIEGDEMVLPVEYYVDSTDDWGGTELELWALGPWVDCPDGKYTTKREHHNYPGTNSRIPCKIGERTRHEFRMRIPQPYTQKVKDGKVGDSILFMLFFKGQDGKSWPWHVRRGGPTTFLPKNYAFRLDSEVAGNLFTYDEPVTMQVVLGPGAAGTGQKTVRYEVFDVRGQSVAQGEETFGAGEAGQRVALPLAVNERGTFRLVAKVDGWGEQETTFARIPDLLKLVGTDRTRFGAQLLAGKEEAVKAAKRLGLTTCRVWLDWKHHEPAKGEWRDLDRLARDMQMLNDNGIDPWLLFDNPPAWAIDSPTCWSTHFSPFPFRDRDLADAVTKIGTELKGKVIGFEWLNEIVPGNDCLDPVADYVRFCRVGTAAAKRVDPSWITTLAGGLWPRTFRKSLLAAGVAEHVDVLPVHYSNHGGIEEARSDLDAVGADRVRVWDNETARGWSTWTMPLSQALQDTAQCNWVLSQWPGELLAGAERVVYFGGQPDPAGNWSYMWGDMSPRPLAATIGVLVSKLYKARPLGRFTLGQGGMVELFEGRDGRPVMVVSSIEKDGEALDLVVGAGNLVASDYQGNETTLAVADGRARLDARELRHFVEGGDLDVLKAYVVPEIVGGSGAVPQFSMLKGADNRIFVRLRNLYDRTLECSVGLRVPMGWTAPAAVAVSLQAGETKTVSLPVDLAQVAERSCQLAAVVDYTWDKLPDMEKTFSINVIAPEMVGNLIRNGGFESADGGSAAHWGKHKAAQFVAADRTGELGHGENVLRFGNTGGGYASLGQKVEALPGGQEFVYSAWLKSRNLPIGSNVLLHQADGKTKSMYQPHVFVTPPTQEHWDLFSVRIKAPDNLTAASFVPVCKGAGEAFVDNVRVSLYEGSDFIAEAHKVAQKIVIDGKLDDFDRSCPVPLLGKSQLRVLQDGYAWTPANLSGVAYINWDETNLYLGVEVIDDVHRAQRKERDCVQDDSLTLGIHPLNRQPGQESKAFELTLSATHPGGSGRHTIYRPAERSGGLASGSLAKDSSLYEIRVVRDGKRTVYEVAMPLNDLGGIRGAFGTKVGLSLRLNDTDDGAAAAMMLWGGGLQPAWSPQEFGILTLVNEAR